MLTIIPPEAPLKGRVTLPGSKSVTNRALLIAALAKGTSCLTDALKSDDTFFMAQALRALGVSIDEPDDTTFIVSSEARFAAPATPLFLGNAGTATRFLTAAATLADGTIVIDGDQHMRKRPIAPLTDALASIGVDACTESGCPPVTIQGTGRFPGGRVTLDGTLSSQYVSAMLMVGARGQAPLELSLTVSDLRARGYVDLTLGVMSAFGSKTDMPDPTSWRVATTGYRATDFKIEPDASAATYLWAAEALTKGSLDLGTAPSDFNQPDARAYDLIARFPNLPATIDGSQMQDAVPTLAVLAIFNETPVRFTGIANLRVKECDRISALATELSRIQPGLGREEGDDLVVEAQPELAGQTLPTRIETYADHRIAMGFALAGLRIGGLSILDPDCVAKTYPDYWKTLASLGVQFEGD